MTDRVLTFVIILVAVVWAISATATLLDPTGHPTSEWVNGIFATIVGGAVAAKTRKSRNEEDK